MTLFSSVGIWLSSPFILTAILYPTTTTTTTKSQKSVLTTITTNNNNTMSNNTSKTSSTIEPRYNGPKLEDMTEKQREIREMIIESRPRTGLSGPFGPWLAIPEIAEPASTLGKACRYDTSLSFRESELVILLTGAKMKSNTEFEIHTGEALKAGLTMDVINAIPRDDNFSIPAVQNQLIPLLDDDREKNIVKFTAELLDTCTVSDETYAATKSALDNKDSVLVEITSITGYYAYVSYTLNVFQIPPK
jgi:4-carboxymuconolactone decarboxylase